MLSMLNCKKLVQPKLTLICDNAITQLLNFWHGLNFAIKHGEHMRTSILRGLIVACVLAASALLSACSKTLPEEAILANIDSMQDAVEEEIRRSVEYCMTHGGIGKRYILSTSNCIFEGMPHESYEIMLDQYKRMIR